MGAFDDSAGKLAWARRVALALGVLSLFATLAAILYGSRLVNAEPTGRDSYSVASGIGHHGFYQLAKSLGYAMTRGRSPDRAELHDTLIIAEPTRLTFKSRAGKRSLGDLLEARTRRGLRTVVVLPKWRLDRSRASSLRLQGAMTRVRRSSDRRLRKVLRELFPRGPRPVPLQRPSKSSSPSSPRSSPGATAKLSMRMSRHLSTGSLGRFRIVVPELQLLSQTSSFEPLLGHRQGVLVGRVAVGKRRFVLVSDPDLLHNFAFHRGDHAALWDVLLRSLISGSLMSGSGMSGSTLVIDEVLHGFGQTPSLGRALGRFPAVLLVVQIAILALVLVLSGVTRSGPSLRPAPRSRRGARQAVLVPAGIMAMDRNSKGLLQRYRQALAGECGADLAALGGGEDRERSMVRKAARSWRIYTRHLQEGRPK